MSVAAAATSPQPTAGQEPLRVMVVDDAVVVRGLVSRWINAESDLKIVASLHTGQEAIEALDRIDAEIVLLDVEMPVLGGMAALPELLKKKPDLVVIMVSTLTRRNAEVTLKALTLGATDYISKPDNNHEITTSASFRRDLIEKIRHLGSRRRRKLGLAEPRSPQQTNLHEIARPSRPVQLESGNLRGFAAAPPRILLIGASTGGPPALSKVIAGLGGVIDRAPVLITQHMPPTFTTIFAEHLARMSGRPAAEAQDGEPITAGKIYVAPGGRHFRVRRVNGAAVASLDDGPPVNFCKPAVDPLFSSAAEVWGGWNLAVILTGMGADGTKGATDIVRAGGSVMAQDEASSVVWGMPGSAVNAGICSAVLPLERIGPKIIRLFCGDRQ